MVSSWGGASGASGSMGGRGRGATFFVNCLALSLAASLARSEDANSAATLSVNTRSRSAEAAAERAAAASASFARERAEAKALFGDVCEVRGELRDDDGNSMRGGEDGICTGGATVKSVKGDPL